MFPVRISSRSDRNGKLNGPVFSGSPASIAFERAVCEMAHRPSKTDLAKTARGGGATADESFRESAADSLFQQESGGGEPPAQPESAVRIRKKCVHAGSRAALDACGYASGTTAREVLCPARHMLFGFKHMNPETYRKHCGRLNELILQNVEKIRRQMSKPIHARAILVSGFNDSRENPEAAARFICFPGTAFEKQNRGGWTGKMRLHSGDTP